MGEEKAIKIHVLKCGSVKLMPREAYIADKGILAQRVELPNNAFLIQHPDHGNILIDTGWSYHCRDILPKGLLHFYEPEISPGESAEDRLVDLGIKPEDIDLLLLSHLDIDHTCALSDFAGKAKRIICAELEYFYSCRTVFKMRQVWDSWMPYADKIERQYFRASVLGPVKRGFDIFGDDSVICIYCPGHTYGSFITVVSQSPSNRFIDHGDGKYGGNFVVFAADTAFSQKNIDEQVVPGYGFDRKQQMNALSFLRELQTDQKHFATLFSHSTPKENLIIL